MMRLVQWAAPQVERVAAASLLAGSAPPAYQNGHHYQMLTREPGSERSDLPIWVSSPHLIKFNDEAAGPIVRTDVPGVQGAFVLSNVLSAHECHQMNGVASAMGFTEDAPVSLGRRIRRNNNCVWIADDSLWLPIWRRIREHAPKMVDGGEPAGLNQRWRLYRYGENDIFKLHTDGSWPGSRAGQHAGRGVVIRDAYGDRWSQMTLLLYLDDDYDGGETSFLVDEAGLPAMSPQQPGALMRSVSVPQGGALCFFHGEHALSPLHEGSLVTRGVKTIVRSDVLYMSDGKPLPPDDLSATPADQRVALAAAVEFSADRSEL
eukprot:3408408-Pleurochrysis_carterae.AAC.4